MASPEPDPVARLLGTHTVMSDLLDGPYDEDDILAAEHVVGAASAQARAQVARRIETDMVFAARIRLWEQHFAGLNTEYGTLPAPRRVKRVIDARLFGTRNPAWKQRFWRSPWVLTAALLFALVAIFLNVPPTPVLVADLQAEDGSYHFVFEWRAQRNTLNVATNTGILQVDQTFEAWVVPTDGAPVSLGTFGSAQVFDIAQDTELAVGTILAVSIEPISGSPTGAPTGPIVAIGSLEALQ